MGNIVLTSEIKRKYPPDSNVSPTADLSQELSEKFRDELTEYASNKEVVKERFYVDDRVHWDYIRLVLEFKQRHNLPI